MLILEMLLKSRNKYFTRHPCYCQLKGINRRKTREITTARETIAMLYHGRVFLDKE
ncbi:MAG: hypothetical protein ACTSP4_15720 [Candidatus Hodarchaeales archaeon]